MASSTYITLIFTISHLILQVLAKPDPPGINCPSTFQCATLGTLGYPFTTNFNPNCGLCVLNCTEPVQKIGLTKTGPWYDILGSFASNRSFLVGDQLLLNIVNDKCDVIENSFRFPRSSLVEFTVLVTKTLWSCPRKFDVRAANTSGTLRRLTECSDHNVYRSNITVGDIPGCEIVLYPTHLMVELSAECSQCVAESGVCQDLQYDGFRCINKAKEKNRLRLLLGIGVAIFVLILVAFVCICSLGNRYFKSNYNRWSIRDKGNENVEAFLKIYGSLAPKRYTYSYIKQMTTSFKHKLGEGGYGTVYKGKLPDGRLVAVKKLKKVKGNGKEFINEVVSISRTNHVNIVALLGFCSEGINRALVYEFMLNGSLEKYVSREENKQQLSQETQLDIAVGVAKGLDYLHKGCNARILHLDIKPHNILLDEQFFPKISDFGLAKLSETKNSVTFTSEARGTIGYIAPEVFCRTFGAVSHKSDVYSYGMMVLDMACGRKNVLVQRQNRSEQYFPDWIYTQLELEAEDGIRDDDERGLLRKMILVGLWCIQTYPSSRPSMNRVVEMLEGELELIEMPPKPLLCSPPRSEIVGSSTGVPVPSLM